MPKRAAPPPEEVTIDDIFGVGGHLQKSHPTYEFRSSQLEMARIADEAFQKRQQVLIEAGTGTGKTLAYLIPAIRSGRKVVISTATKSLQEQLFQKDVPFLKKHFAPNLKVALMKGRANFLCRQKVHQMDAQAAVLKGIDEVDWFAQICDWEKLTETGDRNELTFLADDADLWNRIDARSDFVRVRSVPNSTGVSSPRCSVAPPKRTWSSSTTIFSLPTSRSATMISARSCRNTPRSSSTKRTKLKMWPAIISAASCLVIASRN